MYALVQEIGRVDWDPTADFGDNQYKVHYSFPCLLSLYVRIMQTSDKTVCEVTLAALFEVLKLIVIPTKCQHMMMEEYFENPLHRLEKQVCGMMCFLCNYGTTTMSRINRGALQSRLIAFFTCKCPTPSDLVNSLSAKSVLAGEKLVATYSIST